MKETQKHRVEAGVLCCLGIVIVLILVQVDAWENFHQLTRQFEVFELDEILLMLPVAVLLMAIFLGRRLRELRRAYTRLKQSDMELKETHARVESLQRSREEFLSFASHELKNPLTGVICTLQLLEGAKSEEDLGQRIAMATKAAQAFRASTLGILDATRLILDNRLDKPQPFEPATIMEDATTNIYAQAKAKGLAFELTVGPDVPASVLGYGNVVLHVVQNLAENAVKFTREGEVSVSCERSNAGDDELVITVADTGTGISDELIGHVFEPYTQGVAHRTAERGVGLGLSLSSRMVDLLGGTLEVRNASDDGTVFTVTVPFTAA